MLPRGPYTDIDRTVVALGFLSEVHAVEEADCALTSRDEEDLRRLLANGSDEALSELYRREVVSVP